MALAIPAAFPVHVLFNTNQNAACVIAVFKVLSLMDCAFIYHEKIRFNNAYCPSDMPSAVWEVAVYVIPVEQAAPYFAQKAVCPFK